MYSSQTDHNVLDVGIRTADEDSTVAVIEIGTGSVIPLGGGRLMPVPVALHRFAFNKSHLKQLIDAMTQAHDNMTDETASNIITASNLNGVEEFAELDGRLRTR